MQHLVVCSYMGGCQNHGPFLGTRNIRCRSILEIQKRAHNFDNHPYRHYQAAWRRQRDEPVRVHSDQISPSQQSMFGTMAKLGRSIAATQPDHSNLLFFGRCGC